MINEVLIDLDDTLKMIKNDNCNDRYAWLKQSNAYGRISQCYAFSNENLNWYYPLFNIKDNDILTVCGSGDQVLCAILFGAKSVDIFDSNKLAYYHLLLKMSAIKSLDFKDFIKFYTLEDYNDERCDYCNLIEKNISDDGVRLFWNQILFDKNNLSHCFISNYSKPTMIAEQIPYLNEENYNLLKSKLENVQINFKNVNIFKTVDVFDKQYSFVNLSNILHYIHDKETYISFINVLSNKNLKENGSILLNYYLDNSLNDTRNEIIYKTLNVESYELNYNCRDEGNQIQHQEIKIYRKKALSI